MTHFSEELRGFARRRGALAIVLLGGALAVSASAQEDRRWRPPEATIYRDAGYRGPAVFVNEAKPDMGLAWPVNSIRIASGAWELCERTRYRGTCRTYTADTPILNTALRGRTVQSLRPAGSGGGGGGSGPGPGDGGPSLRGMAAEFFTQPSQWGQRVRACTSTSATAACAARSADTFCKQRGWTGSASQTMETVNRVIYLADVLCTRTGY